MPTARTASSNVTCLLPEPSWSQAVLLFLHTLPASPAVPSKEPEQERWAGKQAGRKSREESRAGTGKVGGRREGEKRKGRGGGGRQGDGGRGPKKHQQNSIMGPKTLF